MAKPTALTRARLAKTQKYGGTRNIYPYDFDNRYPNRVIDIINDSPSGKSAVNLFSKYIVGNGFLEENFYNYKVNKKGLTVDRLLKYTGNSIAVNGYCLWHINFNANYKAIEINPIPSQYGRLTNSLEVEPQCEFPDQICIYNDWDNRQFKYVKNDKLEYFHKFNTENIRTEVKEAGNWSKYKGQIWYITYDLTQQDYVLCPLDSVLEDCLTESESKRFRYRNAFTGFLASHMLVTRRFKKGEKGEPTDEELNFRRAVEDCQGGDNGGKIFHVETDYLEDKPELIKMDITSTDNIFEYTDKTAKINITTALNIPLALMQIETAGKLGTTNEKKQLVEEFNHNTQDERNFLSHVFENFFDNFWFESITKDYDIIPINYYKTYATPTAKEMAEIAAMSITPEQKETILKEVGIEEDVAKEIAGYKTDTNGQSNT